MATSTEPVDELDDIPVAGRNRSLDSLMIERARHEHVPYLRRLKESVMTSRYRPAADADEFDRWRELHCTDEHFSELLDRPDTLLLSIGSPREPVGMVVLHRHGTEVEVDDLLCLHPGLGEGTRLLRSCLAYAEVWRAQTVSIDVYPGHTDAERFLERHGFRRAGDSSNELGRPMHRYERRVTR